MCSCYGCYSILGELSLLRSEGLARFGDGSYFFTPERVGLGKYLSVSGGSY